MLESKHENDSEVLKTDLKQWLNKYNDYMIAKGQSLQTSYSDVRKEAFEKSQTNYQISMNSLKFLTTNKNFKVQHFNQLLEAHSKYLKPEIRQINMGITTMSVDVDTEIQWSNRHLTNILTKNNISVKPIYEVEEDSKSLLKTMDSISNDFENKKLKLIDDLKQQEIILFDLQEVNILLADVEKKLIKDVCSLVIEHNAMLKMRNLNNVTEATMDSKEVKELQKEISDLQIEEE